MGDSLDALLGLSGSGEEGDGPRPGPAGRLVELPVASLRPNEYQPRSHFDEDSLAALTSSIRELGVLQPVLVREIGDGGYELIAGERRWRAARRAGLTTIPAIVREADDQRSLEEAIVENLHRSDLNALEEAAAYRQLMDEFSLTQDEIAQRVGRSRSAVANTLRLFQLPPQIQRLLAGGALTAGHARALLAYPEPSVQIALALRVVEEELSVREVEDMVRSASQRPGARPDPGGGSRPDGGGRGRPAALLEMEHLLSERLDTRVSASMGKGRGRLIVEFADLEDLDRIFRILSGEL